MAPMPLRLQFLAALLSPVPAAALDNGVARTPPMGWNSWGHFRYGPSAQILAEQAAAMVRLGLKDAGYQYINVDDGYLMSNRSASGRLQPACSFGGPGEAGMKNLSQYIHSLGAPPTCA
eukprot:SAG22_NODE_3264_length_1822_cov_1.190946_2_plen_119_part_00